ncbi:SAM-dependent methyltransferase [Streptomyces sp. NPDC059761]|uniref:SAM-dependent methyltransferase n=1 Tax=Streptomyces sp. NPDC059761 TaxID=3346937 RepID=UPI0036545183
MGDKNYTAGDVGAYYDQLAAEDVRLFGQSIHHGMWEADSDSFTMAQDRLTDMVGEKLNLRPGWRLLDVGCGNGRPAIRLATGADCKVTGVTVSRREVELATRSAAKISTPAELDADFMFADASCLPFAGSVFDAALAIESVIHFPDKIEPLREVYRVLRPGGLFVVADITRIEHIPASVEKEASDPALPIDIPETAEGLCTAIEGAGFSVLEVVDLSDKVRRSHDEFLAPLSRPEAEGIDPELVERMRKGIPKYVALARQYFGYGIIVARKPEGN